MDTCHIFFLHSVVHHIFIVLHIFPPLTSTPSTSYQQIVFSTCWLIYSKYSYYFPLMKNLWCQNKIYTGKVFNFSHLSQCNFCPFLKYPQYTSFVQKNKARHKQMQSTNLLITVDIRCHLHISQCEWRQQALKPDREMGCCWLKKGPTGQILGFRSLQPAPLFWPQQC